MRKFSQRVLSVVVALMLFTTAISLSAAPAQAQDRQCISTEPTTLAPDETCTLVGAQTRGSIAVTAALTFAPDLDQVVRIRSLPPSIPSDCNATLLLNRFKVRETVNCNPANRTDSIIVTNVEIPPGFDDAPVRITWGSNTR